MRIHLSLAGLLVGASLIPQAFGNEKGKAGKAEAHIAISQIAQHPSLDEIRQGLTDTIQGKVSYSNAAGNMTVNTQIASKLVGEKPDVLVGISTPSTQALMATKTKIPIVFSGVNDPLAARLVPNLAAPGANVTGVMLLSPVAEQVDLILECLPKAQTIAILFSSGEDNSVAVSKVFKDVVSKANRKPLLKSVTSTAQVQDAVKSLVGKADAVYLPTDNTVISALGAILQAAKLGHLPVFAADTNSVKEGALAALGVDHYQLGVETGHIVLRILQGEKPSNIPVAKALKNELHINRAYAHDMGLEFPASVLKKASKIYN